MSRTRRTGRKWCFSSGHCTVFQPALEVLQGARSFRQGIVGGKEKVKERLVIRGIQIVKYKQANGRFSLACPESLVVEASQILA